MKRYFWIGFLVFFSHATYSQLSLGLVNGNYSGSSGSIINPSSMANTKLRSEFHLVTVSAFGENNYLYFPSKQSSLIKLVNGNYDYHFFPKPYGQGERQIYTYYHDKSLKNFFVNARLTGPSAMFSYQDHVFAVRTGFRSMSSSRRLPYDMANFSYYGMDFKPQQNIFYIRDNYDVASMAWGEVMFSYATVFNRSRYNHWSLGISAGPLFGYGGAYLEGGETRYIAYNDSILNVDLLNGEFGFALPIDYQEDIINYTDPLVRGYGWGMDLGITWQYRERPYQRKVQGHCYDKRFESYKIKVGFSLLDIGWVSFGKNAERHVYDSVFNHYINVDQLDYNNIRDELNTASELFYGNPDESLKSDHFRIYLPATVSVQFDYHIKDFWFINGTVVVPAKYTSPMIERPVVLAVTPRFESRFLEINIPVVLYDYKYPRIGLSVRFDGLTIGTDNLGSFSSHKDFTGSDIYVSYKINLRNDGKNPFTSRGACYNNWRYELKRLH